MMNMNFVRLTLTDVITAAKMGSLGWKQCHCERSVATRYSSDEAVRQAIRDILTIQA